MDWAAFLHVHEGLQRQGPGTKDDVAWAFDHISLPVDATIVDLACGTGADTPELAALPDVRVLAIEKHAPFVNLARERCAHLSNVSIEAGEMTELAAHPRAPFDVIWCAGALYILGLDAALRVVNRALDANGALIFSEPAHFTETPPPEAVAFWEGYPTRPVSAVLDAVQKAGFDVLASRTLSDAAWEAYYGPMQARIDSLRGDANLDVTLDYCAGEAPRWRKVRSETGYLLVVAQKR